jgi:pteridine reductase
LNSQRDDSAVCIQADLQDYAALQQLAEQACLAFGGVDALLNNASAFTPGRFGEVTCSDWNRLLDCNLKAPFFLSQLLAPSLKERHGCIVNMVDIHAENGLPDYAVYSISKAGLEAMTRCLAKEMAPQVRVNAIAPGAILWPEAGADDNQQTTILQRIALQRCGAVQDIAQAVKFLLQDADYITGHTLTVDGGRRLFV